MYYGVERKISLSFGKHELVKNSQTDKKTRQPDRQTNRQKDR